ncbi:MAG TPA: hypothetical protein VIY48_08440 [Candidatus Paceibacterota bacterium]
MEDVDYMADYREAQAAGHHVDCDGYMTVHRSTVVRNSHGSWEAVCEECGTLHIGSYGDAAKDVPARLVREHMQELACDHRCLRWDAA